MIPKILHYCWFGDCVMPMLAKQCIDSWQKYMPEYKLMRWDEGNFDIKASPLYVRQAYESKKYAFVSDYVRLWALEQYGGVYMDVDFEVFRSFDDIMESYDAFAGYEGSKHQPIMQGVIASKPHGAWVIDMLRTYDDRRFILPDGRMDLTTNTSYFTSRLLSQGFVADGVEKDVFVNGVFFFHVMPVWAFCPILTTGEDLRTNNTYCIHRGLKSWSKSEGIKSKILLLFSPSIRVLIIKIKRNLFG